MNPTLRLRMEFDPRGRLFERALPVFNFPLGRGIYRTSRSMLLPPPSSSEFAHLPPVRQHPPLPKLFGSPKDVLHQPPLEFFLPPTLKRQYTPNSFDLPIRTIETIFQRLCLGKAAFPMRLLFSFFDSRSLSFSLRL